MMVRGECYQLPPWARDTGATVFGELSGDGIEDWRRFYCTPTTVEAKPSAKSWHKNPTVGDDVAEEREKIRAESAPWPTPTAKGNGNRTEYGGKSGDGLDTAVKRAGAPSATGPIPKARDCDPTSRNQKPRDDLKCAVEMSRTKSHVYPNSASAWPTPTVNDSHGVSQGQTPRDILSHAVEKGETKSHIYPTVGTKTMGGCSGSFAKLKELEEIWRQTPEERRAMSSHLTGGKDPDTANCGMLNPDWVEWLMGWPIGWTDIDDGGELLWLELDDDPAEWEPPLMHRITRKKKHRVKRIETLGNGQVPLCAAVAFAFGFEIVRVVIEGRSAA